MPNRETQAAAISEAHIDGLLMIEHGRITYANPAAVELLGGELLELEGELLAAVFGLDTSAAVEHWLGERSGQAYEEQLVRPGGGRFTARVGVSTIGPERYALSVQDLSEAKALAAALEAELVALETSRAAALASKQELIEALSLPMLRVWEGVIAVPLIGPLDAERAADVLERLLDEVVACSVRHVILDLTGLESVDAASAASLTSMIRALALVGSSCALAGIKPSLAQLFVSEGLELVGAVCFSSQADALAAALRTHGWTISRSPERGSRASLGPRSRG